MEYRSVHTVNVSDLIERELAGACGLHAAGPVAGPLVACLLQRAFTQRTDMEWIVNMREHVIRSDQSRSNQVDALLHRKQFGDK